MMAHTILNSESEYLAGLLELFSDDCDAARNATKLVTKNVFTTFENSKLFSAIDATLQEFSVPTQMDLANVIRRDASDTNPTEHSPEFMLMIGLVERSARQKKPFHFGIDRRAKEIVLNHKKRGTLAASDDLNAAIINGEELGIHSALNAVHCLIHNDRVAHLEWMPFPVETLPSSMATFVNESAQAIGCGDGSTVALPLLAAVASAIGLTRFIEAKPGWKEPSILWCAVVSESGTQKSPAMRSALQFIHERQSAAWEDHQRSKLAFEHEQLHYDKDLSAWKTSRKNSAAGDAPVKPSTPIAKRFILSDSTIEALAPILADNPRGVLLACDELGGWFGSFDQYRARGGGDVARWLSMHSGEALTVDRKTSGTIHVARASVNICGCIPPAVFKSSLGTQHTDNGLLARLLLAMPPRTLKKFSESTCGITTVKTMQNIFEALFALSVPVEGPKSLTLSPSARRAYEMFYNENAIELCTASGAVASMLSKNEAVALRLALVVHVVRQAGDEPTLKDVVDLESMNSGIVLARWFSRESRRVYSTLLHDSIGKTTGASSAYEWIRNQGGSASLNDLRHGPRAFRGPPEIADTAVNELVDAGLAVRSIIAASTNGGRPEERITLSEG